MKKLGKDAVAYYAAAAGAALATMTDILSGVSDVQLDIGAGSAKTTTRACQGWETDQVTLKTLEVTCKIPLDPSDAGYKALAAAFLAGTSIPMAFLTDAKAVVGAEGPVGDFCVTKFGRNEPLDGVVEVDVTLKLSKFTEWHISAAV